MTIETHAYGDIRPQTESAGRGRGYLYRVEPDELGCLLGTSGSLIRSGQASSSKEALLAAAKLVQPITKALAEEFSGRVETGAVEHDVAPCRCLPTGVWGTEEEYAELAA